MSINWVLLNFISALQTMATQFINYYNCLCVKQIVTLFYYTLIAKRLNVHISNID